MTVGANQSPQDYWANKCAIVTGGASGIGLAITKRLHALGVKVSICSTNAGQLETASKAMSGVESHICDISNAKSAGKFVEEACQSMGRLDILVNNAAISGPSGPLESLSDEDWDETIATNLSGLFRITRAAIPYLKSSSPSSIVNIGSTAGSQAFPNRSAYCSSKWAVVGMTKTLARELGPSAVRANVIAPGIVDGERIRKLWTAKAKTQNLSFEEIARKALSASSLGQLVSEDEVADAIEFVCGPGGRSITGQTINVCGGTDWIAQL
jgi:NAD(P)-dependent dehydrogenase (short-subunit alcohol dehydrogenase family)